MNAPTDLIRKLHTEGRKPSEIAHEVWRETGLKMSVFDISAICALSIHPDFVQTSTLVDYSFTGALKVLFGWRTKMIVRVDTELNPGHALGTSSTHENIPPRWWLFLTAIFGPTVKPITEAPCPTNSPRK